MMVRGMDLTVRGMDLTVRGMDNSRNIPLNMSLFEVYSWQVYMAPGGMSENLYPIPHGPMSSCINVHEEYTLVDSRFTVAACSNRLPLPHATIPRHVTLCRGSSLLLQWASVRA